MSINPLDCDVVLENRNIPSSVSKSASTNSCAPLLCCGQTNTSTEPRITTTSSSTSPLLNRKIQNNSLQQKSAPTTNNTLLKSYSHSALIQKPSPPAIKPQPPLIQAKSAAQTPIKQTAPKPIPITKSVTVASISKPITTTPNATTPTIKVSPKTTATSSSSKPTSAAKSTSSKSGATSKTTSTTSTNGFSTVGYRLLDSDAPPGNQSQQSGYKLMPMENRRNQIIGSNDTLRLVPTDGTGSKTKSEFIINADQMRKIAGDKNAVIIPMKKKEIRQKMEALKASAPFGNGKVVIVRVKKNEKNLDSTDDTDDEDDDIDDDDDDDDDDDEYDMIHTQKKPIVTPSTSGNSGGGLKKIPSTSNANQNPSCTNIKSAQNCDRKKINNTYDDEEDDDISIDDDFEFFNHYPYHQDTSSIAMQYNKQSVPKSRSGTAINLATKRNTATDDNQMRKNLLLNSKIGTSDAALLSNNSAALSDRNNFSIDGSQLSMINHDQGLRVSSGNLASDMYNKEIDYMNKYLQSLPDYKQLSETMKNSDASFSSIHYPGYNFGSIGSGMNTSNPLMKSNSYHFNNGPMNVSRVTPNDWGSLFGDGGKKIIRSISGSVLSKKIDHPDIKPFIPQPQQNMGVVMTPECDGGDLSKSSSTKSVTSNRGGGKQLLNDFWLENSANKSPNIHKTGWDFSKVNKTRDLVKSNIASLTNIFKACDKSKNSGGVSVQSPTQVQEVKQKGVSQSKQSVQQMPQSQGNNNQNIVNNSQQKVQNSQPVEQTLPQVQQKPNQNFKDFLKTQQNQASKSQPSQPKNHIQPHQNDKIKENINNPIGQVIKPNIKPVQKESLNFITKQSTQNQIPVQPQVKQKANNQPQFTKPNTAIQAQPVNQLSNPKQPNEQPNKPNQSQIQPQQSNKPKLKSASFKSFLNPKTSNKSVPVEANINQQVIPPHQQAAMPNQPVDRNFNPLSKSISTSIVPLTAPPSINYAVDYIARRFDQPVLPKSTSNANLTIPKVPPEIPPRNMICKSSSSSTIYSKNYEPFAKRKANEPDFNGWKNDVSYASQMISKNNEILRNYPMSKPQTSQQHPTCANNFFIKQSHPQANKVIVGYPPFTKSTNIQIPINGNLPSAFSRKTQQQQQQLGPNQCYQQPQPQHQPAEIIQPNNQKPAFYKEFQQPFNPQPQQQTSQPQIFYSLSHTSQSTSSIPTIITEPLNLSNKNPEKRKKLQTSASTNDVTVDILKTFDPYYIPDGIMSKSHNINTPTGFIPHNSNYHHPHNFDPKSKQHKLPTSSSTSSLSQHSINNNNNNNRKIFNYEDHLGKFIDNKIFNMNYKDPAPLPKKPSSSSASSQLSSSTCHQQQQQLQHQQIFSSQQMTTMHQQQQHNHRASLTNNSICSIEVTH